MTNRQVVVRGPLWDVSGYGAFTRYVVRGLFAAGQAPRVSDISSTLFSKYRPNSEEERRLLEVCVQPPLTTEELVGSFVINSVPATISNRCHRYNILYTMIETDRISPWWVECCNAIDSVWVPGPFNEESFRTSGVKRVKMVKPGFDTDVYRVRSEAECSKNVWERLEGAPDFNFIIMGHLFYTNEDRKGIKQLIRCFARAFEGDHNVGLILKTQLVNHTVYDQLGLLMELKDYLKKEGYPEAVKNITVVHDNYTLDEIASLYNHPKVKCFVTSTMGEGIGLCVSPDTYIQCPSGVKTMKDIGVGDEVLAGDGNYHRVLNKTSRVSETIKIKISGSPELIITPDHPVLILKYEGRNQPIRYWKAHQDKELEWVKASDVKVKDLAVVVRPRWNKPLPGKLDLMEWVDFDIESDENYVWNKMGYSGKHDGLSIADISRKFNVSKRVAEDASRAATGRSLPHRGGRESIACTIAQKLIEANYVNQVPIKIKRFVKIDKDFLEFIGWYMAEGSVSRGHIELSLSAKEIDVAKKFKDYLRNAFGLECKITIIGNKCRFLVSSTILCSLMAKLCGIGAYNKRFHPILWKSASSLGSLIGCLILGDGYKERNGYLLTTASKSLAWQTRFILATSGIYCTIKKIKNGKSVNGKVRTAWLLNMDGNSCERLCEWTGLENPRRSKRRGGTTAIITDKYLLVPIRRISPGIEMTVMDISVDQSHEFTGNGIVLHNCLLEASACGLPIMATNWSEHINLLDNNGFIPIPCEVKPVQVEYSSRDDMVYMKKARWAHVDDGVLQDLLVKFADDPMERRAGDYSHMSLASFGKGIKEAIGDDLRQKYVGKASPRKVQIACGPYPVQGYFHIDIDPINTAQVDLIADAKNLSSLDQDSVDEVLMTHFLEHLQDWEVYRVLFEAWKVLRPGGTVKVSVPDFDVAVRLFKERKRLDSPTVLTRAIKTVLGSKDPHVNLFDFERLKDFLESVGFHDVQKSDEVNIYDKIAGLSIGSDTCVSLCVTATKGLLPGRE